MQWNFPPYLGDAGQFPEFITGTSTPPAQNSISKVKIMEPIKRKWTCDQRSPCGQRSHTSQLWQVLEYSGNVGMWGQRSRPLVSRTLSRGWRNAFFNVPEVMDQDILLRTPTLFLSEWLCATHCSRPRTLVFDTTHCSRYYCIAVSSLLQTVDVEFCLVSLQPCHRHHMSLNHRLWQSVVFWFCLDWSTCHAWIRSSKERDFLTNTNCHQAPF